MKEFFKIKTHKNISFLLCIIELYYTIFFLSLQAVFNFLRRRKATYY